jgi:hypothetical protein
MSHLDDMDVHLLFNHCVWVPQMILMRHPRERDPKYLAFLRTKPCCLCGQPSEACHIRSASLEHGKSHTGLGEKPSDRWCVPLCRSCHGKQHSMNELAFWKSHGVNPFTLAQKYYAEYQRGATGPVTTKKPRSRKTIYPKGFGPKIRTRPFPKAKRKFLP